MTDRQKQLLVRIQPQLSAIYQEAAADLKDRPVGWMVNIRVPRPLTVERLFAAPAWAFQSIHVMKTPDGLRFRLYDPPRKGWTPAKWRRLHP